MRKLLTLLRFVLEIQGAIVTGMDIDRASHAVLIHVRRHGNAKPRCPKHPKCVLTGGYTKVQTQWRHLNMMRCTVYLVAKIREGRCSKCDGRRLESVPWAAAPRARHTKAFDRQVASLVQVADKSAAKRMFNIAWRTVGRIVKRVVDACLSPHLLDDLVCIGVDETSYKRGHRYITIVSNLITGRVVWVGKGKSSKTLGEFFEILGPQRAGKLELVTMDMGQAYQKAVGEWAPQADIVFDRFHVVKLMLEAMDDVRKEIRDSLSDSDQKVLKGTRFALFRNPKNLTPGDKERIALAISSNAKLARAYQLRVDFEQLWDITDEETARKFLMRWTRSALLSRREGLIRFAKTVRKHMDGILGFIRWGGATNASLEGMANKIKLCIHKAYGFRSIASLMAMIQLCCSGIDLS